MNPISEDILCVHYAELAPSSEERLYLLGLIGLLLSKFPGSYTHENLGLIRDDWDILYGWINRGNGLFFWRLDPSYIHVQHKCEKHILIGTAQLIADVSNASQKKLAQILPTINDAWEVARAYIQNEVLLEMDNETDDC